jgi:DinB family
MADNALAEQLVETWSIHDRIHRCLLDAIPQEAHESHHRGQIVLTLKQAGHPVDRKTAFRLWEWGAR